MLNTHKHISAGFPPMEGAARCVSADPAKNTTSAQSIAGGFPKSEMVFTRSSVLTVYNQGLDPLVFSITDQPGVINPESQVTVEAGAEKRLEGEIPVFTKYYLNVQNPNLTFNGKWKVKVG